MNIRKIVVLFLSAIISLVMMSCSGGSSFIDIDADGVSLSGDESVVETPVSSTVTATYGNIQIGGYNFASSADYFTQASFDEIKECGIDFILDLMADGKDITKLVKAQNATYNGQTGVGWYLSASGAGYREAWKNYSSFRGVYYYDEPKADVFSDFGMARSVYKQQFPDHEFFINLFPMDAVGILGNVTGSGYMAQYQNYLDQYVSKVNPSFICFDSYPLKTGTNIKSDYLRGTEKVAAKAVQSSIPMWGMMNSLNHLGYRIQSANDFRFQANCQLAFGAQTLIYYEYWTHPTWDKDNGGNECEALIKKDGTRSIKYDYAKTVNDEIHKLGTELLKYKWSSVIVSGDETETDIVGLQYKANLSDPSKRVSAFSHSANRPAFAGLFKKYDGSGDAVMVVNYDNPRNANRTNTIEIAFRNATKADVCLNGNWTYNVELVDGKYIADYELGEARFIIPKA